MSSPSSSPSPSPTPSPSQMTHDPPESDSEPPRKMAPHEHKYPRVLPAERRLPEVGDIVVVFPQALPQFQEAYAEKLTPNIYSIPAELTEDFIFAKISAAEPLETTVLGTIALVLHLDTLKHEAETLEGQIDIAEHPHSHYNHEQMIIPFIEPYDCDTPVPVVPMSVLKARMKAIPEIEHTFAMRFGIDDDLGHTHLFEGMVWRVSPFDPNRPNSPFLSLDVIWFARDDNGDPYLSPVQDPRKVSFWEISTAAAELTIKHKDPHPFTRTPTSDHNQMRVFLDALARSDGMYIFDEPYAEDWQADYLAKISNPIGLREIRENLLKYPSWEAFCADIRRLVNNAREYYETTSLEAVLADILEHKLDIACQYYEQHILHVSQPSQGSKTE